MHRGVAAYRHTICVPPRELAQATKQDGSGGAATQFLLLATFRYRTLCLYGAVDDKPQREENARAPRIRALYRSVWGPSHRSRSAPQYAARQILRQANLYLCRRSSHTSAELGRLAAELRMAGPIPHIAARSYEPRHTRDLLARLNGEAGVTRALALDKMPDRLSASRDRFDSNDVAEAPWRGVKSSAAANKLFQRGTTRNQVGRVRRGHRRSLVISARDPASARGALWSHRAFLEYPLARGTSA
jgi:hypothetical protein